jgi:hypothetical protein
MLMEPSVDATLDRTPASSARSAVKSVTVLMPVWGYRFVSQFLEFSLPTLLAPGNLPAVASMLPCRFVLLSSEADEPLIRANATWRHLEQICATEIQCIDDLITDGNHTATITLAFARAVRQAGDAMLDTCFIFLVSDYLMADGSLRTVVDRFRQGASGVVAGNFQIVAEDAIPLLRRRIDPASTSIVLSPRELVSWSLAHLHPATVANMVNFGLSHNAHTNRLFWRVDESTLIGRFYLMHMIAIRPEVTDFVVGASCDYSFIPEMCPSGNVMALTDSDDYLVVEMQPREHESKWLLPGPLDPKQLADSLSEWTTAQHRGNVANTLVYHAGEVPRSLAQTVKEADAFVDSVRARLSPEPHPYRHHHYWIGSIASNRARTRRPLDKEDWKFLLGEAVPIAGFAGRLWRLRAKLFGSAPDVTRLHPRWPDYGLPLAALRGIIADNGRTLLIAAQPAAFARWVTRSTSEIVTLESERLMALPRDHYLPLLASFDACLMILTEGQLKDADGLLARVGPLLRRGGQILIMATNERPLGRAADFGREFVHHSARLLDTSAWVADIRYVPASRLRWVIYRGMGWVLRRGDASGWRSPPWLAVLAMVTAPLALAALLTNLRIRATAAPTRGVWSSVFLILRPSMTLPPPLPRFRSERDAGTSSRSGPGDAASRAAAGEHDPSRIASSDHRDPVRLAQMLARYRFVADLLSPRHDVAEYGCAESLGTSIVLRKVRKIAVYGPERAMIADQLRNFPADSRVEALEHDILSGPLPKRHDSIYCFNAIHHISRSDEDVFVQHLRDSLSRDYDILIIGCPASHKGAPAFPGAAQAADSHASAKDERLGAFGDGTGVDRASEGICSRTGAELKALVERHFNAVFSFSLVGEVMHPGIVRAADYMFVLCCCRKH